MIEGFINVLTTRYWEFYTLFFGIIAVVGGIVAVIFLINTLVNVNKILKRVDGIIEKMKIRLPKQLRMSMILPEL